MSTARTEEQKDKDKAKYHDTAHMTRAAANHEAIALLRVSPEDILTFDTPQAAAIVQDIIEKEGLVQFFNNAAIYFGRTSRRLELETLRFLVSKGAERRNSPNQQPGLQLPCPAIVRQRSSTWY